MIYFVTFMQNGNSALMIACSRGDNAIVQLLLNNNANVNHQALVCLLTSAHMTHIFALHFFSVYTHLCALIFAYLLFKGGETAVE